jgi:hypothetical protein
VVSTTISLSHATICASSGAESVVFKDAGLIVPVGSYVVSITDGTHIVISQAAIATKTAVGWFGGFVSSGAQVQ